LNDFDKLELSTETLRELTSEELASVAGGAAAMYTTGCDGVTQTMACPSGATWFAECTPDLISRNC
jgi:hypothetical protein